MILLFRKHLNAAPEKMAEIANLDNSHTIKDKAGMIRSIIVLGFVILIVMEIYKKITKNK